MPSRAHERVLLLIESNSPLRKARARTPHHLRAVIDSPPHGRPRLRHSGQNRVRSPANALLGRCSPQTSSSPARRAMSSSRRGHHRHPGGRTKTHHHRDRQARKIRPIPRRRHPARLFIFPTRPHAPARAIMASAFAGDAVDLADCFPRHRPCTRTGKISTIRDYLLKGETAVVWKGRMDISSATARSAPRSPAGKRRFRPAHPRQCTRPPIPPHAAEYRAAIDQDKPDADSKTSSAKHPLLARRLTAVHRRACLSTPPPE